MTAGTPAVGSPTTVTLVIGGSVVGTTAFPGTLTYTFRTDTTASVSYHVNSGNVTWTTSCGLALPTSTEQCKNGGYETFGFKNQGDCVSFVTTEGKNEPGKNVPSAA